MHIPFLAFLILIPIISNKDTRDKYLQEADRLLKSVNEDIKDKFNKIINYFSEEEK